MIKEAIDRILELSDSETFEIGDRTWRKSGFSEITLPVANPLQFYSLSSFIDFAAMEEEHRAEGLMIIVIDPTNVELVSTLNREKKRECYAHATAMIDSKFPVGTWMCQDAFVTSVQSHFLDSAARNGLLKIAGNLRGGTTAVLEDDGVTQRVTTARGVVSTKMEEMPNPVVLQPWETFSEIEQPSRKYITRLRNGKDNDPIQLALFPVPDPTASKETCLRIAEWLVNAAPPNLKDSVFG